MALSEADEMLLKAETAEETKKALELGANVNARAWYESQFVNFVNIASGYGPTALMSAKTPEQTKLLLEAGADVNMGYSYRRGIHEHHITALSEAKDEAQALLLLKAGADIEGFQENNTISFKQKIEIVEKFKKEQQIESQKGHLQERQEYLAERKGEKISSPAETTTHDSNSPTQANQMGVMMVADR